MKDTITPKGHVQIEIIRADGSHKKEQEGPNAISSELTQKLAFTLQGANSAYGVMTSAFDNDDFSTPPNNESGIIIVDTSSNRYQTKTTLDATTQTSFTIKGVVRASQSYTIDKALMGHDWSTQVNDYDVKFSEYDFSPNISLSDGDQLNVTWVITIANS